jgi:hypothetical protein
MKVNKKAILAMLVTMIMSLGMMGGINGNSHDSNLQQAAAVCNYAASNNESSLAQVVGYTAAGLASGVGGYVGSTGLGIVVGAASNPVGWIAIGCGVCFLF